MFLRATFMLRFGVRAWAVAMSSAKALKKRIFCVSCAFTNFLCVFWQLVTTAAGRAKGYGPPRDVFRLALEVLIYAAAARKVLALKEAVDE